MSRMTTLVALSFLQNDFAEGFSKTLKVSLRFTLSRTLLFTA